VIENLYGMQQLAIFKKRFQIMTASERPQILTMPPNLRTQIETKMKTLWKDI
jgi:hypothetical protein